MKQEVLEWMQILGLEAKSGFALAVTIFVAVAIILSVGVLLNFAIKRLLLASRKTATLWDDTLLESFKGPVTLLVWTVGLTYAAELAWQDLGQNLDRIIANLRSLAVIVSLAWLAVRFLNNMEKNILSQKYKKIKLDAVGLRALNKILKAAAVITAALMALGTMGYSISGVLAFGGIGGIAIGFAARDLLANFFGGLMLYLDRPFSEGERISSPDGTIRGTVENIGWRLTRIRTFEMRSLYVPNSTFASIAIENISRMTHRRIREMIGVRYDDIAKVPSIAGQIEDMFIASDKVDTDQSVVVRLVNFGASSVDIFINIYTQTVDWSEFHKLKQQLLMQIHSIVEDNGAEIAFPTTTVHLAGKPTSARPSQSP